MKTLKKVLGAHSVSNDTKKFVDKHVTAKHPDAHGNGDDVFQATNVKPVDREKERHGYSPENDHKVYEASLSPTEQKERERIAVGMKKSFASFKQKYGKDAKSVMYATATKLAKEETEVPLAEGEEAAAQFQKYHDETSKLLKHIQTGLNKHHENVTSKKNYNGGVAHWGHVGDIKEIHRSLQDIHDRILQTGEYSKPPTLAVTKTSIREDLNLNEEDGLVDEIFELYELLEEEQQAQLIKLLEDEKYDDVLTFIETLGDE